MSTWPPIERDTKSAAFFDAAAAGTLVIKGCTHCGQTLSPEAAACTACGGTDLNWVDAEGTGTLISWTVVHRAPNRAYTDLVPYTIGIVELAEGPWLYARIAGAEPSAGLPLRVDFVHTEGAESHPIFREAS
ncbi:Zn-ribbon domain-containing OB-fold protein [Amycolatopsis anabasis]|uniref:Zn-ribbon domain-containing OB-fold protein n=1 Tax=Amycolatopsis anabasis TaxID=1840409 RepID=UPI00131BCFF0|nr:OB-fold domain-containing protein [Amycolatopsis anabasis]